MIIKKQLELNFFQCAQFRKFERCLIQFITEHYIIIVSFVIINSDNQFIRS